MQQTTRTPTPLPAHIHNTQLSTPALPPPPMPPNSKGKQWGPADKKFLLDLIRDNCMNILDTSLQNIEDVRLEYFSHWNPRNFRQNFRDFAALLDLETEYTSARQHKAGKVVMSFFFSNVDCQLICYLFPLSLCKKVKTTMPPPTTMTTTTTTTTTLTTSTKATTTKPPCPPK